MNKTHFLVIRYMPDHAHRDYLKDWDERWQTVCSGQNSSIRYRKESTARHAAARANRLFKRYPEYRFEVGSLR